MKRAGWKHWIGWWPRRAAARPEADFAGLGTAFGLDLSLSSPAAAASRPRPRTGRPARPGPGARPRNDAPKR